MTKIVVIDFWYTLPDLGALDHILRDYTDKHANIALFMERHIKVLSLFLSSLRKFTKFDTLCLHALELSLLDAGVSLSLEQMEEIVSRISNVQLFDEVDDTLLELKDKGYQIALYTILSSKTTQEILKTNKVDHLIDYIETAEDHPALLPSIESIKHIVNRFQPLVDDPTHLYFVSGSAFSCGAAKTAMIEGLKVIRVARPPKAVPCFGFVPCPNAVVSNLRDVLTIIDDV
ncbi:hypothetical protein GEMRC1_001685 [Eukaryota sp. GEM-RC1]